MVKKVPTVEVDSEENFEEDNFDFGSDPDDAPETIRKSEATSRFKGQTVSVKQTK